MNVTVYFLGICTHVVTKIGQEIDTVRVVMVDATQGLHVGGDESGKIPPHQALLYLPTQFVAGTEGRMDGLVPTSVPTISTLKGVALEIGGSPAVQGGPVAEDSYGCLPSLTKVAGDNGITQPLEIDRRTLDAGGAAGVFTIRHGRLDAFTHCEAVHGKVTVSIEGTAELRVLRMWDRSVSTITLQSAQISDDVWEDPVMIISNTGIDDDKTIDFLLHYGVTTLIPQQPFQVPNLSDLCVRGASAEEKRTLDSSPARNWTITHGCSNSIYP